MSRPIKKTPRSTTAVDAEAGRRIKLARLGAGMSQTDLGDKVGITFQQIQKYENGTNRIGASRLQQIADVLKVPVSSFFAEKPQKSGNSPSPAELLSAPYALRLVTSFADLPHALKIAVVQFVETAAGKAENAR